MKESILFPVNSIPLSETITAKCNPQGFWYLEENRTGRVSQDLYISFRIASRALNKDGGFDGWEEQIREEGKEASA